MFKASWVHCVSPQGVGECLCGIHVGALSTKVSTHGQNGSNNFEEMSKCMHTNVAFSRSCCFF